MKCLQFDKKNTICNIHSLDGVIRCL